MVCDRPSDTTVNIGARHLMIAATGARRYTSSPGSQRLLLIASLATESTPT